MTDMTAALSHVPRFEARLAASAEEVRAAQRLRYEVFVEELGGDGVMVDHDARIESDAYDPFCEHLLLIDSGGAGEVVGVYRLMTSEGAARGIGFYSAGEYDLAPLLASGRSLLELGRSCLHADYRGSAGMFHLWNALAEFVISGGIEVLFGVASFHGTDVDALAQPLSYLHYHHLAPPALRVRVLPEHFQRMDLLSPEAVDRKAAMTASPALIKAYLRLGGFVGEGAYVDEAFNTTDVCLVMDTGQMSARHREFYTKRRGEA
jgi:putative hemolysin